MLTSADPNTTSVSSDEQLMASRPHLFIDPSPIRRDPLPFTSTQPLYLLLVSFFFFFSSFSSPLSPCCPLFSPACRGRAMTEVSAQVTVIL
ncbi:hypothetical protein Q5P01_020212 [Channa striata]|uniref:Uncharacterized protein n=1 Tax=Channa striata TaxID=64152 RepID=A0AA88S1R5_CHASR|nr:hypothetical protein Q5P01_020212 [Channa striata]